MFGQTGVLSHKKIVPGHPAVHLALGAVPSQLWCRYISHGARLTQFISRLKLGEVKRFLVAKVGEIDIHPSRFGIDDGGESSMAS